MTVTYEEVEGGWRVVEGSGGVFGGGKSSPTEQEDTLRSKAKLNVLFLLSEGQLGALPDSDILRCVYFDETPIKNADGSLNFKGFKVEYRDGTQAQSRITKIEQTIDSELDVSTEVKLSSGAITRSVPSSSCDSARVRIYVPQLVLQDDKGNVKGTDLKFQIQYNSNGGPFNNIPGSPFTLKGKTTSGYQKTYEFDLAGSAPWQVRITRISPDSDSKHKRELVYQALTAVTEAKLRYPNSALLQILIDAEQFSNAPKVSVRLRGMRIKVPSNYDPVAKTYTGSWNGTFQVAYSNNPAWVFYDMLTNPRYGAGKRIEAQYVDKWSLYEIGKYCDEKVPAGIGKTESRFNINVYIQDRTDAYELLNSLASVFRGMLYWASGSIYVTQDKPKVPTKLFNESNVLEEHDDDGVSSPTFTYSGTGLKARHTVALVSYSDPTDFYKTKVEYVEDEESLKRYGYRPTDITAFGCTSRTQARRVGLWTLISERVCNDTIEFNTDTYGAQVIPGEIAEIADPLRSGERTGGRIRSSTTSLVQLDAPYSFDPAKTYLITTLNPDGFSETRPVNNPATTTDTISVSSPFSSAPIGIWAIESNTLVTQQYNIISVAENAEGTYSIVGTKYNSSIFGYVDNDLEVEDLPISNLPNPFRCEPPSNITVVESLYTTLSSSGVKNRIDVSWTPSPSPNVYQYHIEMQLDDGGYERLISTPDLTASVLDAAVGKYDFRVQAVTRFGAESSFIYIQKTTQGIFAPPVNVTGFYLNSVETIATLNWDIHPDLDVLIGGKFVIRHTPKIENARWSDGLIVGSVSGNSTQAQVPLLAGTYMIKAVDATDNESLGEALISTNVPTVTVFNFVQEVVESPGFAGDFTNIEAEGGSIQLIKAESFDEQIGLFDSTGGLFDSAGVGNAVSAEGSYDFNNPIDLGEIYSSRITANVTADVFETSTLWDAQEGLWDDKSGNWDGGDSSKAYASLEISTSDDAINFAPFKPFFVGDYRARAFKFKLKLYSLDQTVNIRVTDLRIKIDMPDRVESGSLTTNAAGSAILFTNAFRVTPTVGVTVNNSGANEHVTVTAASSSGFTVRAFAGGVGVVRDVSWIAKGYGKEE